MNRVKELFQIKYPIIQGGMVWCSGWRLVSAVSNSGGLGLIGSGSMTPDILKKHIRSCKLATDKPFGVNIPLLYHHVKDHIKVILDEHIPIVFTSAGNPLNYTKTLQAEGIKVVHVVSNIKFALKSIDAGVDAIVAEGFEAGGHNGKNETTSFCLIPEIKKNVDIPVIAAGGISSGKSMMAAFVLGAEGVQIGSRFAVCQESSAHDNFKNIVRQAKDGETVLCMKDLTPVRLLKNPFYHEIKQAYDNNISLIEKQKILGNGRAKKGIFEGDLINGELEIGQVSSMISENQKASEIISEIINDFSQIKKEINHWRF